MSVCDKFKLIDLKVLGDERGSLIAFEKNTNVPFDVKRVFYIFDTKNDIARGCHANRDSEFLLVVINGSCRVKVDDGKKQHDVLLNRPNVALHLKNMVWKEMYEFSYNTILMVLASEYYNESEYIRDYSEFLKVSNNK